ncbi:MAG: RloB family protein [Acidimicrobiales bacterium]
MFCEGERTEPEYIFALKQEPAVRDIAAVDIRLNKETAGSVPMTLVRAATDHRQRADKEEGEIDEIWCIFDVEWPQNHPDLPEAITLAHNARVNLAISNPCFELWLALHFQDQAAWLKNDDARRLRRVHDAAIDKGLDGTLYMPLRHAAKDRARSLETNHAGNDTKFPHDNPSSGMHRFIQAVESKSN